MTNVRLKLTAKQNDERISIKLISVTKNKMKSAKIHTLER